MDIRKMTAEDVKRITIENFEKNNKEILDTLSNMMEQSVNKGRNFVDTESLFFSRSFPDGLQNYLINKGFGTRTSCNGNLSSFYW